MPKKANSKKKAEKNHDKVVSGSEMILKIIKRLYIRDSISQMHIIVIKSVALLSFEGELRDREDQTIGSTESSCPYKK